MPFSGLFLSYLPFYLVNQNCTCPKAAAQHSRPGARRVCRSCRMALSPTMWAGDAVRGISLGIMVKHLAPCTQDAPSTSLYLACVPQDATSKT